MSSLSYCQGLASCLEPTQLEEPCILRIELARNNNNNNDNLKKNRNHVDTSLYKGFSFLECLYNSIAPTQNEKQQKHNDLDTIYTPPSMKRSASVLSEKSLEMCTESLGSETGSDVITQSSGEKFDHGEITFASAKTNNNDIENFECSGQERSRIVGGTRRMIKSVSFPPPLTSISGSRSVQVRTHREEGRLVLQAVSAPSCLPYFHAERSNGRLKLHLVKDCSGACDHDEQVAVHEKKRGDRKDNMGEGMDGNSENAGGETGNLVTNLQRPSRCKEGGGDGSSGSGNKALLNWETFWVST